MEFICNGSHLPLQYIILPYLMEADDQERLTIKEDENKGFTMV